MVEIILRSQLSVPASRQRSSIDKPALYELRDSIRSRSLLHPLVVALNEAGVYQLVAGGRRLLAIDLLATDKEDFICDRTVVKPGELPVTIYHSAERISRMEAEFDENIVREDLPWPDRTKALAELHKLRQALNPEQTVKDTAAEVATKLGKTVGASVGNLERKLAVANLIAKHLDNPKIANARTENEAYRLVVQQEQANFEAELIRRRKRVAQEAIIASIRHGDLLVTLPTMDAEQFDLILTDPPYGVNAGADGFRGRTVHHHNYEDTPESARNILRCILTEGWRISKLKSNLFIFTDIKHFEFLSTFSAQMGWTPWRMPIIWQKSVSEGLVPWGRSGFVHTYDIVFWATKGQRGLNRTHIDVLTFPRVSRNERTYAAEKPIPLLARLIDLTTLPGDTVFDPCAGSGSTLVAAKALQRHSYGLEIDADAVDLATLRIDKGETEYVQARDTAAEIDADAAEGIEVLSLG